MANEAPAIFFSYCHEDSDFALRLAEDLKAAGATVWIDRVDLETGQEWDNAIEEAMTRCPRMLVILSAASVKSKNVRDEIAFAMDEQKIVFPVFHRDCAVPLQLRRIQHVDFRADYSRGLDSLLKALGVEQRKAAGGAAAVLSGRESEATFANPQEEESQRLLRMEELLHYRVISQDSAINALARVIRRYRAGLMSPDRPIGSFLFLGPAGVGKTEVARALAQFMFGTEKSLVRFDMSEYTEKRLVSKLVGSPQGYVGYEEGEQLTERIKRAPHSVVLLHQVEKAHPDLFNILVRVFEDGQLTDGLGNTVDFRNTIIIMTSNIGADHFKKFTDMVFQSEPDESVSSAVRDALSNESQRVFNPRFLNALDEIVIFNALAEADFIYIMELLVNQLNRKLAHRSITVTVTEDARMWIVNKTIVDRSYGARPLRRALQKYIEDPLSEALIQGTFQERPAFIEVYRENDQLFYRHVGVEAVEGVLMYPMYPI